MNITCSDRERIFAEGSAEEWTALEIHAEVCAACAEELRAWKNVSLAAQELKEEWDSPNLWPRIARRLEEQRGPQSWLHRWFGAAWILSPAWQTAAALAVLVVVTGSAVWMIVRPSHPDSQKAALLSNSAVKNVERAEAAYVRAIDELDAQARPRLDNPATPLMASYREKLLILDGAIAELRSQANLNPGNGHLRRELLAMYQEKQDTLEEVVEAKK